MPLRNRVVLEIDAFSRTAAFELRTDLEETEEVTRQFIMGERGQYLSEIFDLGGEFLGSDTDAGDRREGYHLDGGAGSHNHSLTWNTSHDPDDRWGDGSSDPADPSDYSRYDAQGCHPVVKRDILAFWVSQSRTDSGGQARLYAGEWSDGTYADEAGVFGSPATVVINEARLTKNPDDPSVFEGTLELRRTSTIADLEQAADDVVGELQDVVEDWG